MNLVFYVFVHFLLRLLPPRHLIHHYLSQQQIVSILVFMHLNVFIHFLFHLLPPQHLIHHYLSQQQFVSILVFMHLNVFIHFLFHLLPPQHLIHHHLSQQQDVSYYCVYESSLLCLHTFPFSPTSSMTLQQKDVSILVFMHLCFHTFPFSPTSSMMSYSPLSVTTTVCKYSCVYGSMSSYISFFTYFLHDVLCTTICHNNSL